MVLQINHPGPGSLGVIQKGLEVARWGLYRTKARNGKSRQSECSQGLCSLPKLNTAEPAHSQLSGYKLCRAEHWRGATADMALCPHSTAGGETEVRRVQPSIPVLLKMARVA